MTPQMWTTLGIVVLVAVLLVSNRVAPDLAMAAGLLGLMLSRVVDPGTALAGFSHPSVLIIASLFVVAAGLQQTGVVQLAGQRLLGRPRGVREAQIRLMAPVALMSAFMNNTPIVAIYLPLVADWARRMRLNPSQLYLPLSFAAILGGKVTLIGSSSNVVVMALYTRYLHGEPPHLEAFSALELSAFARFWGPAALGLPTMLAGIGFMVALSPRLLGQSRPAAAIVPDARKYTVEMAVQRDSPVAGKSIEDAGLRHLPGLFLIEIERAGELFPAPSPDTRLQTGDRLRFAGILESVVDLRKIRGLQPAADQVAKLQAGQEQRTLVEAVISHDSALVGRTVRESKFRTVYNAAIIAVHRRGQHVRAKIGDIQLLPGDTLLLETHSGFVDAYRNSEDFYLISPVEGSGPVRHERAWVSVAILGAFVALMALSSLEPVIVALSGALAMVASRCVSRAAARGSIHWQVIIVIACALGIGEAMAQTGAAQQIADRILGLAQRAGLGPQAMLFVVFLLAALFGQIVTNNGAAVLMFPITMATAQRLQVSPEPFMFMLLLGAGSTFVTPVSYQTNLMVFGPGRYRFSHFAYLGIPLTLLVGLLATLLCPLVFPFQA